MLTTAYTVYANDWFMKSLRQRLILFMLTTILFYVNDWLLTFISWKVFFYCTWTRWYLFL